jgi:hypothetical protein
MALPNMKQRWPVGGGYNTTLTASGMTGQGHSVVDLHLVHDGEVEFVENDGLRDVRGEPRMALHHRHRPRSPALVSRRELRCATEGERRDHFDRKGGRMIVIDHDGDIGLGLRHPFLGPLKARKYPLPVRLLGLA